MNITPPTFCCLDMDGVLVDFQGAAFAAHGSDNLFLRRPLGEIAGVWEIADILGISAEEFWAPMASEEFWASLRPTNDWEEILSLAEGACGADNTFLLTCPAISPGSLSGKMRWIDEYLPEYRRRYIMAPDKRPCAKGNLLIDDNERNVSAFIESGGGAILVPRPWNRHHDVASTGNTVDYVARCLEDISRQMGGESWNTTLPMA